MSARVPSKSQSSAAGLVGRRSRRQVSWPDHHSRARARTPNQAHGRGRGTLTGAAASRGRCRRRRSRSDGLVAANRLADAGWGGAAAGGPARRGRRRPQRPRGRPGVRQRHLQRVLPDGRRVARDHLAPARGVRPGVVPRAGRAGPPAPRRFVGAAAPRRGRDGGPARRRPPRRRRGVAHAGRAVARDPARARRVAPDPDPAGARRAAAAVGAAQGRPGALRAAAARRRRRTCSTDGSAATGPSCCSRATPRTPTSGWTRRFRASSGCC